MYVSVREALKYVKSVMPHNKALGLSAQLEFEKWAKQHRDVITNKYFPGCWMVAPKRADFHAMRTCLFVAPEIVAAGEKESQEITDNE
jgi:hypothetical protein